MGELKGRIFMTGGSGTLGRAIVNLANENEWDAHFTIYSRDPMRQAKMRNSIKGNLQFVIGDVRDQNTLRRAMAGHDLVLHLAAMKHIPQAEADPDSCYEINVVGSRNVLDAALIHGIKDVVLISTDKACHPINSYGCTKMMMERLGFLYAETGMNVYMPRYGNVVESTGSVVTIWKKQLADGKPLKVTNPYMTRFWLTPERAAEIVVESLHHPGVVYVPKLPALSLDKMIEYTIGDPPMDVVGLRPGEKIHEELMTLEESCYMTEYSDAFVIKSPTSERFEPIKNYESCDAPEVGREEMRRMVGMDD